MSRRRQKKKKQNAIGILLLLVVLTAFGAGAYVYFSKVSARIVLDKETNCPMKGSYKRTAILIDTTDSLSRDQSFYLKKKLDEIVETAELYQRFDVYYLNASSEELAAAISVCNPGDGRDKSTLDSNPRRLKERWREEFFDKVAALFSDLENVPTAEQSPIIEGMKYVSIDAFVSSKSSSKELIVVSDLLQHSSLFSHYTSSYNENEVNSNSNLKSSLPYLDAVSVKFMYVVRPAYRQLQTNKHIVFWDNLVRQSHGVVEDVEMVK